MQIVEDIVARKLKPGDVLPLESEMLTEYGVSRSSLREALRLIEVQGLITIKPGPRGGTEVGRIDPANLSSTLTLYLLMARATLRELFEAWLMVEPLLAQLAAASNDRARVDEAMRPFASTASMEDRQLASGLAFHDTVADLSDNQLLTLLLGAVGYMVTEQIARGVPDFELSDATLHAHSDIADCILARDEQGAYRTMREHLLEVQREIEAVLPMSRPLRFGR
jgi:DNA-binding FadR family transcriptional regulator